MVNLDEKKNIDCIICLEETEETMNILVDRYNMKRNCKCNCSIHEECLLKWLDREISCPICKKEIEWDIIKNNVVVKRNYFYVIRTFIISSVIVVSMMIIGIFICIVMKIILNHH